MCFQLSSIIEKFCLLQLYVTKDIHDVKTFYTIIDITAADLCM